MAKTPHFVKIIVDDDIQQGKLEIPKKFVRKFGNYLSEKVFLKVPGGVKWEVELVKSGDDIWFGDGWQRFVYHYAVSDGKLLVFGFEDFKNCVFNVLIFDKTTSQMDYRFHVQKDIEEPPRLEEQQVHRPIKQENVDVDVLTTRLSEDKSPLPSSGPCKKPKQENLEDNYEEPRLKEQVHQPPCSRPFKKPKQENLEDNYEEPRLEKQVQQLISQENVGMDLRPTRLSKDKSPLPSSTPFKKPKEENREGNYEEPRLEKQVHQPINQENVGMDVLPIRLSEDKSLSPSSRPPFEKPKQENREDNYEEPRIKEQVQQPINQENVGMDVLPTRLSEDRSPSPSFRPPFKKPKQENLEYNYEEPHLEKQVHQPISQENVGVDVLQTRLSEDKSPSPSSRPFKKLKQENHEGNYEEPRLVAQVRQPIIQENVGVDVLPTRLSKDKSPLPSSRPPSKNPKQENREDNYEELRLKEQVHQQINQKNIGVDVLPTRISKDKSPLPSSTPFMKPKQENREVNYEEPRRKEQIHQPINQVDVLPTQSSEDKSVLPSSRHCKKRKQDNSAEPRLEKQVHQPINQENVHVDVLPTRLLSEDKSPLPSSRPCKKRKQENRTTQSEAKRGNENKRTKPEKDINSALNRATTSYKSDNPMFFIVMQRSYIEKRFRVPIPEWFANKYYTEPKGVLSLNSVDGEAWSVGYTGYTVNQTSIKRRLTMITSGWRRFTTDNNLMIGDVCVFEMIDQNASKLKVSFFRENHDVAKSIASIGNSKHQQNKGIPCLKEYTSESSVLQTN